MNQHSTSATAATNGESTRHDLFVLTDEQILEIEPEGQGEVASGEVRVASQLTPHNTGRPALPNQEDGAAKSAITAEAARSSSSTTHESPARPDPVGVTSHKSPDPPAWLAAQMKDPWSGEEAKELWNGVQQARQEAAAYRAAFATPEDARALKELYPGGVSEARTAAERARLLDQIDGAYFGAAGSSAEQTSASRAQLAAMMLREDPAAFREMVFAGLRALENGAGVGTTLGSPSADGGEQPAGGASPAPTAIAPSSSRDSRITEPQTRDTGHEARLAAYAAFEKAANEDLERSVGGTIARTIEQALPNLSRTGDASAAGAQHPSASLRTSPAPLQARLGAAIRGEVEAALKGDRQLGEQIAQILSAQRFDGETRAQVVRLIGERAQQLVPGAAKRVLNDWTQTTLAAHRTQSARADAASARREVAPASTDSRGASLPAGLPRPTQTQPSRPEAGATRPDTRRVDYRKLSDEQILEM